MDYLQDADSRLTRYFGDGGWELYDALPVAQDASLAVSDLLASVALNSGLDTRRKLWQVWTNRHSIEQALTRIPAVATLDQDSVPWEELRELMDACCATPGVKWAVATKVLHKKRPGLIPIYDRHMWTFYQSRVPRQRGWSEWDGRWWVGTLQVFREHLLANRGVIWELCQMLEESGWTISPVRTLEVLIWMAYEPTGEYRR